MEGDAIEKIYADAFTVEVLRMFVVEIDKAAVTDDRLFFWILAQAVHYGLTTARDLRTYSGVSVSTVTRWLTGVSAPHPAMRKHIYAYLRNSAQAVLSTLPE